MSTPKHKRVLKLIDKLEKILSSLDEEGCSIFGYGCGRLKDHNKSGHLIVIDKETDIELAAIGGKIDVDGGDPDVEYLNELARSIYLQRHETQETINIKVKRFKEKWYG